jgi:class 3 adenylate cyclase
MDEKVSAFLVKKHTLPIIMLVFVLCFLLLSLLIYKYTNDYALNEASKHIEDILIEHRAKHGYIEEIQKPVVYELQQKNILRKDFFAPALLSFTYISRNMHAYLMKEQEKAGRRPYIYKLAAINPRNPLNQADKLERKIIRKFNDDEIVDFEEIVEREGETYLYKAIPIARTKKSCMKCHGDPKSCPKDIIDIYGSKCGFFERIGEVRAIISMMAPLEEPMLEARKYFFIITSLTAIVMLFIYSTIYFFIKQQKKFTAKEKEVSAFLRTMFGRYLSEEVMNTMIESPDSIRLGGEKREVTIMMTDLRGFTSVSERLDPEQVMALLNRYFNVMMRICKQYRGTINDIVGDALLVSFGAPLEIEDHAQAAVACAIDMQNSMQGVNEENIREGLPQLEMGIGLNTAEVVIGNIGSEERAKFGVVGSGVNMASRIESYTVGGQILISESVRREAGEVLRIDERMEVLPKGAEAPLTIYEVGGIGGRYNLALKRKKADMVTLAQQVPLRYIILEGEHVHREGLVVRLSGKSAEIELNEPVEPLTNLKMNLLDVPEELAARDFYGKVIEHLGESKQTGVIRFTSVPPEVGGYFQALLQFTAKPSSSSDIS